MFVRVLGRQVLIRKNDDNVSLCARTRPRGPKYQGLKELKPNNSYFEHALFYRTYRLKNADQEGTSHRIARKKNHVKRLQMTLEERFSDGRETLFILEFLPRFAGKTAILEMSEIQAFIAFQHFLKNDAASRFRSVKTTSSRANGGV